MRRSSRYPNEHETNARHYDTVKAAINSINYSHAMSAVMICRTLRCLALGRRFGVIDVAGAVAATSTNTWNQLQSAELLKSPPNDGQLVCNKQGDRFLQKMAALKVKAALEEDVLLEIFSSLHSMSRSFSVPGLAQAGLDHFQLDKGPANSFGKHTNHV